MMHLQSTLTNIEYFFELTSQETRLKSQHQLIGIQQIFP